MNFSRFTSLILLLSIILVSSCKTTRYIVAPSGVNADADSYIRAYSALAVTEMKRTGVPASITLAQGMIESDYGRSRLATEANNHFGIKCHNDWTGPTIRHNDDRRNECFRKYRQVEDSYRDHSDFLRNGSRYSFLFDLSPTDYKGWARGLKRAGYATNPDYADMLIRKIEENSLYNFDTGKAIQPSADSMQENINNRINEPLQKSNGATQVEGLQSSGTQSSENRIMENNRIQYIIVKEGDTKESIERDFKLLRWELERYNELPSGFTPAAGQILYLQPKRTRAEPGREVHTVSEGESIYSVSQKYGIRTDSLRELNRLRPGEEVPVGSKLWLRSTAPVR